nr:hypothetical protein [Mycobacterium tuberculosis]
MAGVFLGLRGHLVATLFGSADGRQEPGRGAFISRWRSVVDLAHAANLANAAGGNDAAAWPKWTAGKNLVGALSSAVGGPWWTWRTLQTLPTPQADSTAAR